MKKPRTLIQKNSSSVEVLKSALANKDVRKGEIPVQLAELEKAVQETMAKINKLSEKLEQGGVLASRSPIVAGVPDRTPTATLIADRLVQACGVLYEMDLELDSITHRLEI